MKNFLLILILLLTPVLAFAEDGPYVQGRGGLNLMDDTSNTFGGSYNESGKYKTTGTVYDNWSFTAPLSGRSDTDTDAGLFGAVAFGWKFGAFRTEAEYGYRANDYSSHNSSAVRGDSEIINHWAQTMKPEVDILETFDVGGQKFLTSGPLGGSVSVHSFMANGYYDHKIESISLTPYVGGGIGLALINHKADLGYASVDDTATAFAYQLMAGVGYEVTPEWNISVEYRYFGTADYSVKSNKSWAGTQLEGDRNYGAHAFNPIEAGGSASGSFEQSYSAHNVSVGVRYSF